MKSSARKYDTSGLCECWGTACEACCSHDGYVQERYWKLHEQGKTEEARRDLERLAVIRAQREEAAKKRAEEKVSVIRAIALITVLCFPSKRPSVAGRVGDGTDLGSHGGFVIVGGVCTGSKGSCERSCSEAIEYTRI